MKISSNCRQGAITIFLGWRQVNSWFPEKDQFWGYMWCPWWESVDSCQKSADLTYIAQGVQIDGTSKMASGWLGSLRITRSVRIITFSACFWKNCLKAANTTCLLCHWLDDICPSVEWPMRTAGGAGWGWHTEVLANILPESRRKLDSLLLFPTAF